MYPEQGHWALSRSPAYDDVGGHEEEHGAQAVCTVVSSVHAYYSQTCLFVSANRQICGDKQRQKDATVIKALKRAETRRGWSSSEAIMKRRISRLIDIVRGRQMGLKWQVSAFGSE